MILETLIPLATAAMAMAGPLGGVSAGAVLQTVRRPREEERWFQPARVQTNEMDFHLHAEVGRDGKVREFEIFDIDGCTVRVSPAEAELFELCRLLRARLAETGTLDDHDVLVLVLPITEFIDRLQDEAATAQHRAVA